MAFDPVRGNAHPINEFTVKDDSGREVRHKSALWVA